MKNIKHLILCGAMLATSFATNQLHAALLSDQINFEPAACGGCQKRRLPIKPVPETENAISFETAACGGCQKRRLPVKPVPEAEDAISFETAACGCQKKPAVPRTRPTPDVENDVGFKLACGNCNDRRERRSRADNDDVAFMLAACGCRKPQNQPRTNPENQERVQRNPLSPKQEKQLYGQIAKMAQSNRNLAGGKRAPASPRTLNITERGWNIFGNSKMSSPAITHFVRETDAQGSIITIQDGSVWSVSEKDQKLVKNWALNSELTIVPNTLSFWNKLTGSVPTHKFRLVHLQTNESVAANMSLGPFKYNPNTRKIDRIDYSRGEVYLTNGSVWKVDLSGPSAQILRDWQRGQAVVCGTNDTWFSLGSPYILICVEKENWLAATRVY